MSLSTLTLNDVYFGNTVAQYLTAIATLSGLFLAFMLIKTLVISRLQVWAARTPLDFDDFVVSLFAQIGVPTYLAAALFIATLQLELPESVRAAIRHLLILVITVRLVLIARSIVKYGVTRTYKRSRPEDTTAEAAIRNITNVIGAVLWALGLIFLLDNFGLDISALVAGLGIGGIAVAMASQALLGDLFSAVSIFVDKPFEVGDFIIVDDLMGTVEYIGLKTTRIRSLHGEQLVFANADLTKSRIRNFKRMALRRVVFRIGVVYQTSAEKVRRIPEIVRSILSGIADTRLDRVHFSAFGDSSLTYEIVYYVLSSDYNVYMDKQQEINFKLKDTFEKEGIDFAYPTQTLYVHKS
ncbi:MAG: hypothetical protein MOGMAGMI_02227 [Candidatus Omnitrophica bacterium]|nr:hypothetical protein [Candidatus Omnitrophota bacterium]